MWGAAAGAVAGGTIAYGILALCESSCDAPYAFVGKGAAMGGVAVGTVGALLGIGSRRERWRPLR